MSLLSYVEPVNCSHGELESVLTEIKCPDILGVECSPGRRWFGLVKNSQPYLSLGLHDMLTDRADWNADTWDLNKSGLDALASFIELFSRRIGKDFSFQAIWAGDNVEIIKELTIGEFVQIVNSNNIGTKTKYLVKSTQ